MNQVTLPSDASVQYTYRMNGYYRAIMGHVTENAALTKTLNWTDENFTALTVYTRNQGDQLAAKQTNPDGSTEEKIWARIRPTRCRITGCSAGC